MRVLHLYSDYRWTGAAEPTVLLVKQQRARGIDARFACRRAPKPHPQNIMDKAAKRGIEPELRFQLNRYGNPIKSTADVRELTRYFATEQIDIVHAHLPHDHVLAAMAARLSRRRVRVVRTNHKGAPLACTLFRQWNLKWMTDGYVGFSRYAADTDKRLIGLPREAVAIIQPALDLSRFDPTLPYTDCRARFGFDQSHVVGCIVARVQRHRRWDVLLQAIDIARKEVPELRFLIIGKGTHRKTAAIDPAERMGLSDIVKFPGYLTDDYVDVLRSMDFKVFLMPGSDGTCRAAREAMAIGLPVIAADRGMLSELVPHDKAGLVIDDTPQNLAAAMVRMCRDRELRQRLSKGAMRHAHENYTLEDQATEVISLYERLLGQGDKVPVVAGR
jgi:glycosyltransferase involved in cell wall biosynthesis